jgi:hypothetical protein
MDEASRKKILARRARFLGAALTSMGIAGCGDGTTTQPSVCLDIAVDGTVDTSDASDTSPQPCLSDIGVRPDSTDDTTDTGDTGPTVCLNVVPDSGTDTG